MKPTQFSRPDGFHDFDAEKTRLIRYVENKLLRTFSQYGYQEVSLPTVEYRDLYHPERIGDELFHQLLMSRISKAEKFPAYGIHEDIDQPDQMQSETSRDVVLRWDLTAPIARMYACRMLEEGKPEYLPIRVAYTGQVFQNVKPERPIEYRQAGVELIGNDRRYADLELLNLACDCIKSIGIKRWELRLGHATLFQEILSNYNLSDEARNAVTKGLEKVVFTTMQANSDDDIFGHHLHGRLPQLKQKHDINAPLPETIEGFTLEQWRKKLPEIQKEHIRRNWIEHWCMTPDVVSEILEITSICGKPDQFFRNIKPFINTDVAEEKVEELHWLSDQLAANGIDVKLSPAATRGIGYYTGITFEFHSPNTQTHSTQFCGGGRYNHLHEWIYLRARQTQQIRDPQKMLEPELSGKILTGVGFAFRLEETASALQALPATNNPVSVFVAVTKADLAQQAFDFTSTLRQKGVTAMCHLIQQETPVTFEKQMAAAQSYGCQIIAAFGLPDNANNKLAIIAGDEKQIMSVEQAIDYLVEKTYGGEVKS